MANRRFGGGPQRGGRHFPQQQHFQGSNVSPWQGGVAPNNSGGLLSQLSAPQQIALALTSLLQPQQQPGNSNPPSLLSLNTSPFSNQDNFGSQSRFNRGHSDFRRPEPYNKNIRNDGNNWRQEGNRRGGKFPFSDRNRGNNRQGNFVRRRSPPRPRYETKPSTQTQKQQEDKEKEANDVQKEEPIQTTTSLDVKKEPESKDKKRDWKEEKKPETKNEEPKKLEGTPDGDKKDAVKREGRYHGVPASLLHCFVCSKSMWDGESFQNHIRGRAHKQMLQSLEESFQITVNILRENMRLVEEKKMIELNRMHRNNRNFGRKANEPESHCNMCDLKFIGKIIAHRKTEGHQRLKRFLHPNCNVCHQEFPARMEWVEHRFSPEHMRKVVEIMEKKVGDEDGYPEDDDLEVDLEPLLEEPLQTESEVPVLELSEDLSNFQNRIPAYVKSRPVSKESLKPAIGFLCELCNRFMATDAMAQAHLRTERHYLNFLEAAKSKYKRLAEDKTDENDVNWKRRKIEDDVNMKEEVSSVNGEDKYDPEEACKEETENETLKEQEDADDEETWAQIDEIENSLLEEPSDAIEEKPQIDVQVSTRPKRGAVKNGAGPKCKKQLLK